MISGGRFDVSGVCIAGIPLPVIGQNKRTAWGFTNTMVDDVDFFIEKIDTIHGEILQEIGHGSISTSSSVPAALST